MLGSSDGLTTFCYIPMQPNVIRFWARRSQVQILSPRLTFPNDFPSRPEPTDVGRGTSPPDRTATAAANSLASRLRAVGPSYKGTGGCAVPNVTIPPTRRLTTLFFDRSGRNDANTRTFSMLNASRRPRPDFWDLRSTLGFGPEY